MDTLWASLLGLFGIALGLVLLFNGVQSWQDRRRDAWKGTLAARPAEATGGTSADADDAPALSDALPVGDAPASPPTRVEPTLGNLSDPDPDSDAGQGLPVLDQTWPQPVGEKTLDAYRQADEGESPPEGGGEGPASEGCDEEPGWVLDPRFDCIVTIRPASPVTADRVLSAVSGLRRAGSKPVLTEVDQGDGRWVVPHAAMGSARQIRTGVLMANRNGPLNAMEFTEFAQAVKALGQALGAGGAVVPDMGVVLDRARQLDETCAQFDAVLGVNVLTSTALSPDELGALAVGLGLQERGNNRYAALGEAGEVLYSLSLGDVAEQLTLLLDVPRAPQDAQPWALMLETAQACAQRTGGRVVDDAGRQMTEAAAAAVGRQLQARYASLSGAGLAAGSASALRVFN